MLGARPVTPKANAWSVVATETFRGGPRAGGRAGPFLCRWMVPVTVTGMQGYARRSVGLSRPNRGRSQAAKAHRADSPRAIRSAVARMAAACIPSIPGLPSALRCSCGTTPPPALGTTAIPGWWAKPDLGVPAPARAENARCRAAWDAPRYKARRGAVIFLPASMVAEGATTAVSAAMTGKAGSSPPASKCAIAAKARTVTARAAARGMRNGAGAAAIAHRSFQGWRDSFLGHVEG